MGSLKAFGFFENFPRWLSMVKKHWPKNFFGSPLSSKGKKVPFPYLKIGFFIFL
uniref:Uncharacterized protein n=1 Tax=Borrelia garinii subsp. bavariensis (strain ATCC BAA-2496 / DSM 23469 / PBi) TaxID=290434 RepID=A0A7I6GX47_BORGP|nr:hypothetical protein BGP004 [Borreliella bavariensis PBi]